VIRSVAGAASIWLATALAVLLGALTLCPGGACSIPAIDQHLLAILNQWRMPWLDAAMASLTWLGSIMVLLPAAVALSWYFQWRGRDTAARLLPLAVGGAWLWAHLAKPLFDRPRPDLHAPLTTMPLDASFPSAHTMQVTAFALALLFAHVAARKRAWPVACLALALVALVALSRMYLQVHFPSDVAFGLIAGAGWVLGLRLLLGARR
jgi:membrane-associated phospholipid phosphatase